jgi:hypothetical protein
MPNNILAGGFFACVAKATISFVDAGITALNTTIIYRVSGDLRSYRPDRIINGITGFEAGKGYYIIAKQDMDLTAILIPPLDSDNTSNALKMIAEFRVGDEGSPAGNESTSFVLPALVGVDNIDMFVDGALWSGRGYTDVWSYQFIKESGMVILTFGQLVDGQVVKIYKSETA